MPSILIVEDDPNIGELLVYMFAREGFTPLLLHDGRAAEAYVSAHDPVAVAILDMLLPYRDGFSVIDAIRSNPSWSSVPIIVLSAKSPETNSERIRHAGIADWVSKPFQPQALINRVRAIIGEKPA